MKEEYTAEDFTSFGEDHIQKVTLTLDETSIAKDKAAVSSVIRGWEKVDGTMYQTLSALIKAAGTLVEHYIADVLCDIDVLRKDFFDASKSGTSYYLIGFRQNGVDSAPAVLHRMITEYQSPYKKIWLIVINHEEDDVTCTAWNVQHMHISAEREIER